MKYKTITHYWQGAFDRLVQEHLDGGWQPIGGVSIAFDGSNAKCFALGMYYAETRTVKVLENDAGFPTGTLPGILG